MRNVLSPDGSVSLGEEQLLQRADKGASSTSAPGRNLMAWVQLNEPYQIMSSYQPCASVRDGSIFSLAAKLLQRAKRAFNASLRLAGCGHR